MNSWRTVKSNLNSYINRNKLYKDKFYIVKKEISPATTEYENAVINSEATVWTANIISINNKLQRRGQV